MRSFFPQIQQKWNLTKQVITQFPNLRDMNNYLFQRTGITDFFHNLSDIEEISNVLTQFNKISNSTRDYGDFQTPLTLTSKICQVTLSKGIHPNIVIEPTVGIGNFVISAIKTFPTIQKVIAIDIQPKYEWFFKLNLLYHLQDIVNPPKIEFVQGNIFQLSLLQELKKFNSNVTPSNLLILGNPPWVTNTELSKLKSTNVPPKSNIKKEKGLNALTGSSNFDLAENIIVKLLSDFQAYPFSLAMLCKNSVIKNLIRDNQKYNLLLGQVDCYLIEAKREFNANVDAALLCLSYKLPESKNSHRPNPICTVRSLENPQEILSQFGYSNQFFVSNIELYRQTKYLEGSFPLEWRQGVKHDAAKIFVLKKNQTEFSNGHHEAVQIESACLYPFLKSSDLQNGFPTKVRNHLIITQKKLNQDTKHLKIAYPCLWEYLQKNTDEIAARKSKIYRNSPPFSMFGIGDYCFAPYKVGISGFYKKPIFSFIQPIEEKPVILDDTCYYISFKKYERALLYWIILNTSEVSNFLSSLIFLEQKRPYTKRILKRINFATLLTNFSVQAIQKLWDDKKTQYHLPYSLSIEDIVENEKELLLNHT